MKMTPEQLPQKKAQFTALSPRKKLEHIWLYYKVPIILAIIAVVILVSCIHRVVTEKETVLCAAFLNVAVGSELEANLTEDYLISRGYDTDRKQILCYRDLYLSNDPSPENHEYAYTSGLKIIASINAKELDLVLMNRESYDLCSGSGYLLDLTELISPEDPQFSPYLTENLVILEDNAIEITLGEAEEYTAVTEAAINALDVSQLPLFRQAGFSGEVYLGIIANSPSLGECANYLTFLTE